MKNNLYLLQTENSNNFIKNANKLIETIDDYMNTFDKKELLSFSNSKEKAKKYKENYFSFLLALSPIISELSSCGAELASLTVKSDNAIQTDITIECEKRFNAFEKFEKDLYEYTENIENAFTASNISTVFLLNAAQKLKNSTLELINVCT